jgi:hypothetical protein
VKPTDWSAKLGTRSCGLAALPCPRPVIPQADPTIAKAINGGYDLLDAARPYLAGAAPRPEVAAGDTSLEAGGGALLRTVQHRPALQPQAARAYSPDDLCQAGSGAGTAGGPEGQALSESSAYCCLDQLVENYEHQRC